MRQQILAFVCLYTAAVQLVSAVPLPADDKELDILQIPLTNGKEIDVLTLSTKDQEQLMAERNRRTIGLLRDLFPDITKNAATDTQIDLSAINKQLEETIRVARQVKEAEAAAQAAHATVQLSQQQQQQLAKLQQQQQQQQQQKPLPQSQQEQQQERQPSKQEDYFQLRLNNDVSPLLNSKETTTTISNEISVQDAKAPAIDDLTLDSNEDLVDLDDRNKRFLTLGGGVGGGGSSAANTRGSGSFLFDIIRQFSGSVQPQPTDDGTNANSVNGDPDTDTDGDAERNSDGNSEAIPGPVTRLMILTSRGIANLIQDLILRAAATSEKFVNFKAKLITALI